MKQSSNSEFRNSKNSLNLNLWGNSVGARDFSPDWKHRYFGTEVPCPDNDKYQFIAQRGGFFQNVADITILYKIIGARVTSNTTFIKDS